MAGGEWFANKSAKVVSIGDMRDAKSVFSLLHEIGHTQETEELPSLNMFRQDSLENLSKSERNAWAKGIRMARQLRQKEDVDLFTLFKDGEDFKKYVYGRLATYKCFAYKSIEQEKSRAPDDISFLRDLFDGEKLDLKKAA